MSTRGLRRWALLLTFWVALQLPRLRGDYTVTGTLTVTSTSDLQGNTISAGTRTDNSAPGWGMIYTDGTASTLEFDASRSANVWKWQQNAGVSLQLQMTLGSNNTLTLFDQSSTPNANVVLNPTGTSSFANSLTVNGTDNEMPNQTLVNSNSVMTEGLADSRYLSSSDATVGTGSSYGNFGGTMTGPCFSLNTGTASGAYSFAEGLSSIASGSYSNALGYNSVASQWQSLAIGDSNNATGVNSTALGNAATASGTYSAALGCIAIANGWMSTSLGGWFSTASGSNSTALGGWFASASGSGSTALGGANSSAIGNYATVLGGSSSSAVGNCSIAGGANSVASGLSSTALGNSSASGNYSTAVGRSSASGYYSMATGNSTTAQAYESFVAGTYNIGGGNSDSWVATDPLFEVGNGTSTTASDALIVYKNGNVTAQGVITAAPGGDIPMYTGN